jgi:hypothetical protein
VEGESRIEDEFFELEIVDGEVVEPQVRDLTTTDPGAIEATRDAGIVRANPKLQTAAAAATGFVAGAATLALLRHYGAAKLQRAAEQQPPPRRLAIPERGATYLVHIRPLGRSE